MLSQNEHLLRMNVPPLVIYYIYCAISYRLRGESRSLPLLHLALSMVWFFTARVQAHYVASIAVLLQLNSALMTLRIIVPIVPYG